MSSVKENCQYFIDFFTQINTKLQLDENRSYYVVSPDGQRIYCDMSSYQYIKDGNLYCCLFGLFAKMKDFTIADYTSSYNVSTITGLPLPIVNAIFFNYDDAYTRFNFRFHLEYAIEYLEKHGGFYENINQ